MIAYIIFLLICIAVFGYLVQTKKDLGNLKITTCNITGSNPLQQYHYNFIKKHGIQQTTTDPDIYYPYDYTISELLLFDAERVRAKYVFIIGGNINLTAKNLLWENLKNKYGFERASVIVPETYLLYDDTDRKKLQKLKTKDTYIVKGNQQQQQTIKIMTNIDDILKLDTSLGSNSQYILAQKYVVNPFLVNKRKINFRIYLLLVANITIRAYVHQRGFIYYTRKPYNKNETDFDTQITTGYIKREVYQNNPLTLEDFAEWLDNENKYIKLRTEINKRLVLILNAVRNKLCYKKLPSQCQFQLFGVDVMLTDKLEPYILEINKGPDLNVKDRRDGELKEKVYEDIYRTLGLLEDEKRAEFDYIWSSS